MTQEAVIWGLALAFGLLFIVRRLARPRSYPYKHLVEAGHRWSEDLDRRMLRGPEPAPSEAEMQQMQQFADYLTYLALQAKRGYVEKIDASQIPPMVYPYLGWAEFEKVCDFCGSEKIGKKCEKCGA